MERGQCYNECCGGVSIEDLDDQSGTRSTNCNGANNARRKMSRWDQSEPNHSNGSLLSTMERFVQTVDDMNETIMIPCRLMDLQFDESLAPPPEKVASNNSNMAIVGGPGAAGSKKGGERVLANLNGVDLYQFFTVLNNIKNDLMWGHKPQQQASPPQTQSIIPPPIPVLSTSSSAASVISAASSNNSSSNTSLSQVPSAQSTEVKGHARRPSTVSTASSTSASDTEFSELNEDSGVEAEHEEEYSQSVADTFHHHLNGLQQCLCDLTIAADYVTTRYSSAVGELSL